MDVDVLVDVDVVLVVVSHPVQVLSHCLAMEIDDEHNPAAKSRSHLARGNTFVLPMHLCGEVIVDVLVEVLVDVDADVEVVVLLHLQPKHSKP